MNNTVLGCVCVPLTFKEKNGKIDPMAPKMRVSRALILAPERRAGARFFFKSDRTLKSSAKLKPQVIN